MALEVVPKGLPTTVTAKSPHLTGCTALKVPPQLPEQLQAMLSAQLVVVVRDAEGRALDATGMPLMDAACVSMCAFVHGFFGLSTACAVSQVHVPRRAGRRCT